MKQSIWILFFCLPFSLTAQFYLRGEVKDNGSRTLEGASIRLSSQPGLVYTSGINGSFGINTHKAKDTITITLEGYETFKKIIDVKIFQSLVLNMLPATARLYQPKLSSITTNLNGTSTYVAPVIGESYSNLIENNFIATQAYPETGFSLNIDKASYSNIRRFLSNEMFVPADAVRIEEMLNYFSLPLKTPVKTGNQAFAFQSALTNCPWNNDHQLYFLQLAAPKLKLDSVPASNLVFLIDVSGSMDQPNRLPLLKSAFKMLVDNLREQDTISVMTYGGGVSIALPATGGIHKARIKAAIDSLSAGGDTPGAGAITTAYELAKASFIQNGNNRVILATDGDFNVGQSSEQDLEALIIKYKQTGIYLTCLGVGMGNYKDSKLETLSKKGNGNFAYIDHIREAEKVLVKEFTKTLFAVASDVSIKVRFNPQQVAGYRLIGFDNKKNALEDSSSVLDGGEIGSGHSIMAVFEINPASRHSTIDAQAISTIQLQYREPGKQPLLTEIFASTLQPIAIEKADSLYRFAAAVVMFGSVLRKSAFTKDFQFEDVQILAQTAMDKNDPEQQEFGKMIIKAIKVYNPGKKKRKK